MNPNYASNSKSTSSYITELFGPKPSYSGCSHSSSGSSSSTTSSYLSELFGPQTGAKGHGQANSLKHGASGNDNKGEYGKSSVYQQETVEHQPHHYSNSIYYGGREVYPPTTRGNDSQQLIKKDDQLDEDPNSASRGNWWQGSLYY